MLLMQPFWKFFLINISGNTWCLGSTPISHMREGCGQSLWSNFSWSLLPLLIWIRLTCLSRRDLTKWIGHENTIIQYIFDIVWFKFQIIIKNISDISYIDRLTIGQRQMLKSVRLNHRNRASTDETTIKLLYRFVSTLNLRSVEECGMPLKRWNSTWYTATKFLKK
jgi:hypothetical protein